MNCKYIYKGVKYDSIDALYQYVIKEGLSGIDAVLYSAGESIQEITVLGLKDLNNESYKLRASTTVGEESPTSTSDMSITTFIDSGLAVVDGEFVLGLHLMDLDRFKLEREEHYNKLGYTSDVIKLLIDNEISHWDEIAQTAVDIHRIGISNLIAFGSDRDTAIKNFIKESQDILPADSPLNNPDLLTKLWDQLNLFYKKIKDNTVEVLKNINVGYTLETGDKIYGKIDYAFVDKDGNINIFNFKVSSQYYTDWNINKKTKYKLEQAILRLMLIGNGIGNVRNIKMHLIPIYLDYNNTFDKIDTVRIPDTPIDTFNKGREEEEYNNKAKFLVKSKVTAKPLSTAQDVEIENALGEIFHSPQVLTSNISRSAREWIRKASSIKSPDKPLVIQKVTEDDCNYKVYIYGKEYKIKENSYSKNSNKEITKLIEDHIIELNELLPEYINDVISNIRHTISHKFTLFDFTKLKNGVHLKSMLDPYLEHTTYTDSKGDTQIKYRWKLDESLAYKGILLFIDQNTGQIDTVVLTNRILSDSPSYKYGSNILGDWLTDRDFILKGTYGNIEAVRAMFNLNYITLEESMKDSKLGLLKIVGMGGQAMTYSTKKFADDYFNPLIKKMKLLSPKNFKFKSNFKYNDPSMYVDPFDTLVSEVNDLINRGSYKEYHLDDILGRDHLEEIKSDDDKRVRIMQLLELMENNFGHITKSAKEIVKYKNSTPNQILLAKLYLTLVDCYMYYSNHQIKYEEKLSWLSKHMFTASTVPDANFNVVVNNLRTTIDSIAEESEHEYTTNLRSIIVDFHKAAGYTNIENMTLGTQNRIYKNLFELDDKGKRTMKFKNPYTDTTLKDYEKVFLKKALFYFHKYNKGNVGNFSGWDDPKIQKWIEEYDNYLHVPLERASKSSVKLMNPSLRCARLRRIWKVIAEGNAQSLYDEFVNGMTTEEREYVMGALDDFTMRNPFARSDDNRLEYLNTNGTEYFETNVENLLVDCMFKAILTEKMNRMLIGVKALLTLLNILGEEFGNSEAFKDIDKHIREYIGLNVFNKTPIENKTVLKITSWLTKVREKVVFMTIAGRATSAVRDIINGGMENFTRTVTHHLTGISAKNLSRGYAYVVKNGTLDATKVTLLSKLNIRYRISNTDTARIAERLKTNRLGVTNMDNILYSTLRMPDFVNRMSLFIAQAIEDGVINEDPKKSAWTVDKDDNLLYDWTKDARFSIFASGDKKHPEYNKQKALYILKIKEWNAEHPNMELQLSFTDKDGKITPLPTPYSELEITAIKNLSDNIFGSYDKSNKSWFEFISEGLFFGLFTTWMNGIVNNWFMKPGEYSIEKMLTELETDENGLLLWYDVNYKITTKNTGVPVLKHVPWIALGIIPTLADAVKILKNDGFTKAKEYIMADERTKALMAHLALRALLAGLFLLLIKCALDPSYKENKKDYKNLSKIAVLLAELSYRSFDKATDSFFGPLNIIEYLGEGTNPPVYKVPVKLMSDTYKTVFGDKTVGQLITGNFAFASLFKELTR